MGGTERISVEEARARGLLGADDPKTGTDDGSRQRGKKTRAKCQACERWEAFFALVRELLADGHEVRLEYKFHPDRRWKLDVALTHVMIDLEIDGGQWIQGRHHTAKGRQGDNERDFEAQRLGWRVIRVTWEQVQDGSALVLVRKMVAAVFAAVRRR